jgi:hypothetical protein
MEDYCTVIGTKANQLKSQNVRLNVLTTIITSFDLLKLDELFVFDHVTVPFFEHLFSQEQYP